ncbi:MAG: hypothetical protein R3F54_29100 [Alphaproteobacteria bacterium]
MTTKAETIDWVGLAHAHGRAERALGRLGHALESTGLHLTWLWREMTRAAVVVVQAGGYRADVDSLRRVTIGVPVDPGGEGPGLAAAKRVFVTMAPLFRDLGRTDSNPALWPQFWSSEALQPDGGAPLPGAQLRSGGTGQGEDDRQRLTDLVRVLAGLADDGRRPALINLFLDLRRRAGAGGVAPPLMRLALPLALAETGIVPKGAPGLLGGRRLALGMSAASPGGGPLSDWLASGLGDLAGEAGQAHRRLLGLTRRHRAWHGALAAAGLRRHARAPGVLDLLAATPVVTIGLVAAHLACSRVAAGRIVERLVAAGILTAATSRSRHKIFTAGGLLAGRQAGPEPARPLVFSEPVPPVDAAALDMTMDRLFADLERLNGRVGARIREGR